MLSELIQRSEAFRTERRKAEQDANRKRAAAASQQHAVSNPRAGEKRPVLVEPQFEAAPKQRRQPSPENKTSTALAAQVGVNRAAVERADFIRKNSPALAQKVIDGEVPASAAIREIRREQKKEELNEIAAQEAVAPTGLFDVIVIDPPWPIRLARIKRLLCAANLAFPCAHNES